MLIFFGIVFAIFGAATWLLVAFANGMSDAPDKAGLSFWPVIILALLSVACFVLRFFLRGHAISW